MSRVSTVTTDIENHSHHPPTLLDYGHLGVVSKLFSRVGQITDFYEKGQPRAPMGCRNCLYRECPGVTRWPGACSDKEQNSSGVQSALVDDLSWH
jgi:hypothetical protein